MEGISLGVESNESQLTLEKLRTNALQEATNKLPENFEILSIPEQIEIITTLKNELVNNSDRYIDVVYSGMLVVLEAKQQVVEAENKYRDLVTRLNRKV